MDAAVGKGTVTQAQADELAARLLGHRYLGIWLRVGVVASACRLADGNPDAEPLAFLITQLKKDSIPLRRATQLVVWMLKEIVSTVVLPERRTAFVVSVLEALSARKDAPLALPVVRRELPAAFGLNIIAAAETIQLIDNWTRLGR